MDGLAAMEGGGERQGLVPVHLRSVPLLKTAKFLASCYFSNSLATC